VEVDNFILTKNHYPAMTNPDSRAVYFWSSRRGYQRKCQLGDYSEDIRQWLWFTKTPFIYNYKLTI